MRINVFDKCHTPWGLLRSGVAPDHQDVKNASNDFEAAFEREEVKFYGGVEIGESDLISLFLECMTCHFYVTF